MTQFPLTGPTPIGDIGKPCPYCRAGLTTEARVARCGRCSTTHHEECWNENSGCAVTGCESGPAPLAGSLSRKAGPSTNELPPIHPGRVTEVRKSEFLDGGDQIQTGSAAVERSSAYGPTTGRVGFSWAIMDALRRSSDFHHTRGRTSSSGFWWWQLLLGTAMIVLPILGSGVVESSPAHRGIVMVLLFLLLWFLLYVSVGVASRRLHDAGLPGFFAFVCYAPASIVVYQVAWAISWIHEDAVPPSRFAFIAGPSTAVSFFAGLLLWALCLKKSEQGDNQYGPAPPN